VSRIEQSGRSSLRGPKLPIKGGSALEEEEEEEDSSLTCFGYIRPSSGALDTELQHMVFCTANNEII